MAEQEKMSVNANESIAQSYMTQETTMPSLAPEPALVYFDTEDEETRLGTVVPQAISPMKIGGCTRYNQFKGQSWWQTIPK